MFAPVVTTRQWQAAKQRQTQFGDRKNRPGFYGLIVTHKRALRELIALLNQASALTKVGNHVESTTEN